MHIFLPAIESMNDKNIPEEMDEESHEMGENRADNSDMMDEDVPVVMMYEVDEESPVLRR